MEGGKKGERREAGWRDGGRKGGREGWKKHTHTRTHLFNVLKLAEMELECG